MTLKPNKGYMIDPRTYKVTTSYYNMVHVESYLLHHLMRYHVLGMYLLSMGVFLSPVIKLIVIGHMPRLLVHSFSFFSCACSLRGGGVQFQTIQIETVNWSKKTKNRKKSNIF
jgi:hypothetical protein